jgi:mannosyltransferase
MIIFNNIAFAGQISGGVSLVWKHVIEKFIQHSDVQFIEYEDSMKNIFRKQLIIPEKKIKFRKGGAYFNRLFPQKLENRNNKTTYVTGEYDIVPNQNVTNVIIVHDFVYEIFSKKNIAYYFNVLPKKHAIKKSEVIVCVSENTKKDLLHFFPKIAKEKIQIIHNGVSDEFQFNVTLTDKFPMLRPNEYVIYIGMRSNYKNFNLTIDSLQHSKLNLKLAIISNKALDESEIENLNNKLGIENYFLFNKLTTEELNSLYSNAYALLYLSKYEGFGIPILEAQRSGCPVIASCLSSIPEVGGDGYIQVKTLDVQNVKNTLLKIQDINYKNEILDLGFKNSKRFSWEETSQKYYDLISSL